MAYPGMACPDLGAHDIIVFLLLQVFMGSSIDTVTAVTEMIFTAVRHATKCSLTT
jgi:hypothetical protein